MQNPVSKKMTSYMLEVGYLKISVFRVGKIEM